MTSLSMRHPKTARISRAGIIAVLAGCLATLSLAARAGSPVNIALVPVGDTGNVSDPLTGYGAVAYPYQVGKYDVTMGQYTSFLNAVAAASDPYGLYNPSMARATPLYGITQTSTTAGYVYTLRSTASANVPVTYVSWGDAARFVNWLQNGEPTGSEGTATTEAGSYSLNGGTSQASLMAVTRSTTASWRLPTLNEWYKAGYYAGGGTSSPYWYYATQSNVVPSNVLSATGTNNANFIVTSPVVTQTDPVGWLTPVGTFANSPGNYGTFDMGGDVDQWDETAFGGVGRGSGGGSFAGTAGAMTSYAGVGNVSPTLASENEGFRVAYIPEPGTATLLFAAVAWCFFLIHKPVRSK